MEEIHIRPMSIRCSSFELQSRKSPTSTQPKSCLTISSAWQLRNYTLAAQHGSPGRTHSTVNEDVCSNKGSLLVTKGIATRSKDATIGAPGLTTSNKRTLLATKGMQ